MAADLYQATGCRAAARPSDTTSQALASALPTVIARPLRTSVRGSSRLGDDLKPWQLVELAMAVAAARTGL